MFSKYLVTGGAGIAGSAVVERILSLPSTEIVVILDNMSSPTHVEPSIIGNSKVKLVLGDVSNEELVLTVLKDNQIECIIDCSTKSERENIVELAQNAIQGITHLLDAVRAYNNLKSFLLVSSTEVYGQAKPVESSSLMPTSWLGAALMGAEAMLHSYVVSYRLPLGIIRLSDVAEKIVEKLHHGKTVASPINLILAKDASVAIVDAAQNAKDGDVLNIGGSQEFTFEDINKVVNEKAQALPSSSATLSTEKAKNELKFTPVTDFVDALQQQPSTVANMPEKILVFGNGNVGAQVGKALKENGMNFTVSEIVPAVEKIEVIEKELAKESPSHVVYVSVDEPSTQGSSCEQLRPLMRDLLLSPYLLANLCDKKGIHFTHIGSGFVFDVSDSNHKDVWQEDARGNHQNSSAGAVRCFTEKLLDNFSRVLQIRLGVPVNESSNGPIDFNEPDKYVSVSVLSKCLPNAAKMIRERENGLFNLVNPGEVLLSTVSSFSSSSAVNEALRSNCILAGDRIVSKFPDIQAASDAIANLH